MSGTARGRYAGTRRQPDNCPIEHVSTTGCLVPWWLMIILGESWQAAVRFDGSTECEWRSKQAWQAECELFGDIVHLGCICLCNKAL